MVHGLWNTPDLFHALVLQLNQDPSFLFAPHLPHDLGRVSIRQLAIELDKKINSQFGSDLVIDILGFSMGGLISRVWLQELRGFERTSRFFSVGTPHNGTLTAQFVPTSFFPGIAEMKLMSQFIKSLNDNSRNLKCINCRSYYCFWDLMVIPGLSGVLPVGPSISIPVFNHKALIKHPKAIRILINDLFVGTPCKPTMPN